MRRPRRASLAAALLLSTTVTACSSGGDAAAPAPARPTSGPSSVAVTPTGSTSPTASTSPTTTAAASPSTTLAAKPAPTVAGDLTAAVFVATMDRWRTVPGDGDEGTYQANGSWVHALAADQVTQGLSMQRCRQTGVLPVPRHVLASDYKDPAGRRAVGMALRFASPALAASFVDEYSRAVASCTGQTNPMHSTLISRTPALVDRRVMLADQTRWVEVVRAHGNLVKMFVAQEQDRPLTAAQLGALAKLV